MTSPLFSHSLCRHTTEERCVMTSSSSAILCVIYLVLVTSVFLNMSLSQNKTHCITSDLSQQRLFNTIKRVPSLQHCLPSVT